MCTILFEWILKDVPPQFAEFKDTLYSDAVSANVQEPSSLVAALL